MIVYVNFAVSLHGLELADLEEVEQLRLRIDGLLRELHTCKRYVDDVTVELEEYAGTEAI